MFFKRKIVTGISILTAFCGMIGCEAEKKIPDVSNIEVDVSIRRFEKDLFTIDTTRMEEEVSQLKEEYGPFLEEVYKHIMKNPNQPDATIEGMLEKIVKSEQLQRLYDTCMLVYGDVDGIEKELEEAFRFYKYYFPGRPVPEVISYISEFALGTFTYGDSLLGVGWDFFLGEAYRMYDPSIFPEYIQRTMNREYIVPKMIETMASNIVGETKESRLIDFMIQNGKILYIKDMLMPVAPDSIKMEYTAEQMEWVENNEQQMWAHFLKEDLIYSTRMQDIQKLINHSPVAPGGMPGEAPGRTANWMGWQIIKAYMRKHPDTTMEDLVALKDAQKLLEQSGYKPQR